jgi:hypothetical protein
MRHFSRESQKNYHESGIFIMSYDWPCQSDPLLDQFVLLQHHLLKLVGCDLPQTQKVLSFSNGDQYKIIQLVKCKILHEIQATEMILTKFGAKVK